MTKNVRVAEKPSHEVREAHHVPEPDDDREVNERLPKAPSRRGQLAAHEPAPEDGDGYVPV